MKYDIEDVREAYRGASDHLLLILSDAQKTYGPGEWTREIGKIMEAMELDDAGMLYDDENPRPGVDGDEL